MNFEVKESFKTLKNRGFSLIELVIVIAVLAILSILSGTYFLRLINLARFESAKNHMRDSFTSCINDPNISPSIPYIPGVAFQSSNCSSLMTATIDNSCTISMDMSTGAKTGWNNSYEECSKASNTASNNGSGNNNKISDWVAYEDSLNETTNVVPSTANSSCEDSWGGYRQLWDEEAIKKGQYIPAGRVPGSSYTGSASFAVDGDPDTKWTCKDSGKVDFELENKELIKSVNVGFTGSTTNGNYVKIYVDDKLVAEGTQPASNKTWLIQPTEGKKITYETVLSESHVVDGDGTTQNTTWSEVGELSINGSSFGCTNKNDCWNNSKDKNIE